MVYYYFLLRFGIYICSRVAWSGRRIDAFERGNKAIAIKFFCLVFKLSIKLSFAYFYGTFYPLVFPLKFKANLIALQLSGFAFSSMLIAIRRDFLLVASDVRENKTSRKPQLFVNGISNYIPQDETTISNLLSFIWP